MAATGGRDISDLYDFGIFLALMASPWQIRPCEAPADCLGCGGLLEPVFRAGWKLPHGPAGLPSVPRARFLWVEQSHGG